MNQIISWLTGTSRVHTTDYVHDFFVHSKSSVQKRVYKQALDATQKDQQEILRKAEEIRKARALRGDDTVE